MPETKQRGGARPGSGPKPKPDTRMVTRAFVITQAQDARLEREAERTGTSKSAALRELLDNHE